MFFKVIFKYYSESKKLALLKEEGIILGTRLRGGRKVYLYMIKDFFVEVIYQHDDLDQQPESIETFSNVDNLNSYLEKEFKTVY